MQKKYYDNEGITGNMNRENHMPHNDNQDYWNILVKDTENPSFLDKFGLDFGKWTFYTTPREFNLRKYSILQYQY